MEKYMRTKVTDFSTPQRTLSDAYNHHVFRWENDPADGELTMLVCVGNKTEKVVESDYIASFNPVGYVARRLGGDRSLVRVEQEKENLIFVYE